MFDSLTDRLGTVFDKLTRRGALSEADVDAALREHAAEVRWLGAAPGRPFEPWMGAPA